MKQENAQRSIKEGKKSYYKVFNFPYAISEPSYQLSKMMLYDRNVNGNLKKRVAYITLAKKIDNVVKI